MNKNEALKLIRRSFDEQLSEEELISLNNALNSSIELKKEKENIIAIRAAASRQSGKRFSPFFADRVMQKIRSQREAINDKIYDFGTSLNFAFRRIAIAGAVVITLLLSGTFLSEGTFSIEKALGLQQVSIEDTWSLNNLISEAVK